MLVREKGKKDADPIGMGWDEAQAAILAGTHEPVGNGGAETGITDADGAEPAPDLDAMTRAELEAHATARGVDVSQAKTKADVLAAIKAA